MDIWRFFTGHTVPRLCDAATLLEVDSFTQARAFKFQ